MRNKATAIIVQNRKLLIVKSDRNGYWSLPGGRLMGGETYAEGRDREVNEELNCDVAYAKHYRTLSYYSREKRLPTKNKAYFVILDGNPEPSEEIRKLAWIDRRSADKYSLSTSLGIIMPMLIEDGIL